MANPHELEPQTRRQRLNYRRGLRHDRHAARGQCADWLFLETLWQKGKLIKRLGEEHAQRRRWRSRLDALKVLVGVLTSCAKFSGALRPPFLGNFPTVPDASGLWVP